MKKLIYCFSALLMSFMMVSCGDPLDKMDSLLDQIKSEGKSMDADQWEELYRDLAQAHLDFWKSEPTKADIKRFDKLGDKFDDAVKKIQDKEKVKKAMEKAQKRLNKDDEFKDLTDEIKSARKKAMRKARKAKEDDEEDDDEDED